VVFMKKVYNFVFPGIGIDYRKIIADDKELFDESEKFFKIAKEKIGIDLDYYLKDTEKQYDDLYEWCLIYTIDCIIYQHLINKGINPEKMIGYSMGLITAVTCSKSISYECGLYLLKTIRYLRKPVKEETMLTLIGFERNKICELITQNNCDEDVSIACENNQYCFVISGIKEKIDVLSKEALKKGVYRIVGVNTDRAFHTWVYDEVYDVFDEIVSKIDIQDPDFPIMSVIDQTLITKKDEVKKELVRNLSSKMLWEKTIKTNLSSCVESNKNTYFVEISLGTMLTKVSKIINKECTFCNYKKVPLLNESASQNKKVFCFEGINDYCGKYLEEYYSKYKKYFDKYIELASKYLEIDVEQILKDSMKMERGENKDFNKLLITFICDCVIYDYYISQGVRPDCILSYSAGLNVALVCEKYISFEDGMKILKCVGQCMNFAHSNLSQDMLSIIGLKREQIELIIEKQIKEGITICCENSKYNFLLAGERNSIDKMYEIAILNGAINAKKLNMAFAFHYKFNFDWMKSILSKMDDIKVFMKETKIFSIYSCDFLNTPEEIINEIKINTYCKMKWNEAIKIVYNKQYKDFWDVSFNHSIKKMCRFNNLNIKHHVINDYT